MADSSSPQQANTSLSQFVSTLIFNLALFAIFVLLFITLRKKQKRVYEPRHIVETVPTDLQPDETPSGAFSWFTHIFNKPESFIIQQAGIDGYFFLRFLYTACLICLVGCATLLPVLLPVNATGGNGEKNFDILSYANIHNKNRFFAHVFLSWLFFGLVLFIIYKELVHYTTFRHVAQTTPLYDSLLSSRTLLLSELPESLLEESELRTLFPVAQNVWYARDFSKLQDKVEERTKLAKKYEGTLNKVISKAVKINAKAIKKDKPIPEPENKLEAYFKKRPTHRLKFLIGKKVDTLDYGVEHLDELKKEINTEQAEYDDNKKVGSVFIEFPTQLELQKAYQAIPYNDTTKKCRRFTGYAPEDIIWENMSLSKNSRRIKRIIANTVLTLMIIFWTIPVAVVGAISNINLLEDKVHFLRFLNKLPSSLMGIVTGVLPTVALAVLMMLVPIFIKKLGKVGGCISVQEVESYCHNWFYAFQVVQGFLVATLASAASAAVTTILNNPATALTLLAQNLPKASNFYISYLLLQGLTISSGALLQLVPLILSHILGRILDSTPRAKWTRYNKLNQPGWGTTYPAYELLLVIVFCYSIISPLIIPFAAIAFALIFVAFLYNLTYVMTPNTNDARGRNYPLTLMQLFVGLYVAELCLIAMFVFGKNWACVGLEAVIGLVTIGAHVYFRFTFFPLFDTVPISAIKVSNGDSSSSYPIHDQGLKEIKTEGKAYFEGGNELGLGAAKSASSSSDDHRPSDAAVHNGEKVVVNKEGYANISDIQSGGFFSRFFKPKESYSFDAVRAIMPSVLMGRIEYPADFIKRAYLDPAASDEEPHIWIAKDPLGLGDVEIAKAEGKVDVTYENAVYNEKNAPMYTGPPPSYEEAIRH